MPGPLQSTLAALAPVYRAVLGAQPRQRVGSPDPHRYSECHSQVNRADCQGPILVFGSFPSVSGECPEEILVPRPSFLWFGYDVSCQSGSMLSKMSVDFRFPRDPSKALIPHIQEVALLSKGGNASVCLYKHQDSQNWHLSSKWDFYIKSPCWSTGKQGTTGQRQKERLCEQNHS